MKDTNLLMLALSIFFVIFVFATAFGSNFMHENAHKQFAEYNGCIDYEINYLFDPHFRCLERSRKLTIEERQAEYILDGMNEVVTYNLQVIWGILIVGFFCLCMTIILVGDKHG